MNHSTFFVEKIRGYCRVLKIIYFQYCSPAQWMKYYSLVVVIIIPLLTCIIVNGLIFRHVRASTLRVQPQSGISVTAITNGQQAKLSRRDIHLLRHMVLMLIIFIIGWVPLYIVLIVVNPYFEAVLVNCLTILAQITIFCDVLNLFIYNRLVSEFLRDLIWKCRVT